MRKFKLLGITLSLFDGAGAAGAAASSGGEGTGTGNQGETQGSRGNTRRGNSGETQKVLYGKQPTASTGEGIVTEGKEAHSDAGSDTNTDVKVTSNTSEDRKRAFREMINGEYKDIYTKETQRILNRRFRESKEMETELSKSRPVMEMLMQRYKIQNGDIAALTRAIENDEIYFEAAAEEAGMSVEQYKEMQRLQRENEAFRRTVKAAENEQLQRNQVTSWIREGEELQKKFPKFRMEEEANNPQFMSLLSKGVPVEHAYKLVHMDEIVGDAMRTTAQSTEKMVIDNVRSRGSRPSENGTASRSAFTVRDDVSKLTREDRAEIARRVRKGEKISF